MINMITKRRAHRYIAAADKEWLYPEWHVSTDHCKKLGDGYFLRPEPRLSGFSRFRVRCCRIAPE
jgi:hypothetical protein